MVIDVSLVHSSVGHRCFGDPSDGYSSGCRVVHVEFVLRGSFGVRGWFVDAVFGWSSGSQ